MDRQNINELLKNDLDRLKWRYVVQRSKEYLASNSKGRLVLDFGNGQLISVFDQAQITGYSQFIYYEKKLLEVDNPDKVE